MCDHWMPTIKLPLTLEQFRQLPRHPAYKYERINGEVWLSPRPRHYHAVFDLKQLPVPDEPVMRLIQVADWAVLEPIFAGAFRTTQPFGSLNDATQREACQQALERTRTGGDGPLMEQASLVAWEGNKPVGAILITLVPGGNPAGWGNGNWLKSLPADAVAHQLGQPHLTWIFVAPLRTGRGIGTALLAAAVKQLLALGFTQLLSTFMIGNHASMLWHWRNGFRLLTDPSRLV